jgi:hypothetical protein
MLGYGLMGKVFGSSGKRSNPIGVISIVTGFAGALMTAVLWIYQIQPSSRIMGGYSAELAAGGQLSSQLTALAAVLGLMAVLASMASSTGGEGGGGYFIGLVLGLFALSYPVLTWLNIVSGPLKPGFLN